MANFVQANDDPMRRTATIQLLDKALFDLCYDEERKLSKTISTYNVKSELDDGAAFSQKFVFGEDTRLHTYSLMINCKVWLMRLAFRIAVIVATPFAFLYDISRCIKGKAHKVILITNVIWCIPFYIIANALKMAFSVVTTVNDLTVALSRGVGFLVWHAGELTVRQIKLWKTKRDDPSTVLSDQFRYRTKVYDSLGVTLVAAGTFFIPVVAIQMIALPIIILGMYQILNHHFMMDCPQYHTLADLTVVRDSHHQNQYDGNRMRLHLVRTHHPLIKPIITGLFASASAAKCLGIVFAGAALLPFAATALPITLAAGAFGAVALISVVATHIFAIRKKRKIQNDLDSYFKLLGWQLSDAEKEMPWAQLKEENRAKIETYKEQQKGALKGNDLEQFNRNLALLESAIEKYADPFVDQPKKQIYGVPTHPNPYAKTPIKFLATWHSNKTRKESGLMGFSTLAIVIATVFVRIFAL